MDLPFNALVSKGLRGDGGSRDPRRVFLPTYLMPASADVSRLLVSSFTVTAVEVLREAEEESDGSWPSSPLVPAVLTCLSAGVAGPGEPGAAWADWEPSSKLEWIIPISTCQSPRRATRPGFNPPSFETAGIYSSNPSNGAQYGCHIDIENNRKKMGGIEKWVRHLCGQLSSCVGGQPAIEMMFETMRLMPQLKPTLWVSVFSSKGRGLRWQV